MEEVGRIEREGGTGKEGRESGERGWSESSIVGIGSEHLMIQCYLSGDVVSFMKSSRL